MNRRVTMFLSIALILVGVLGIFFHFSSEKSEPVQAEKVSEPAAVAVQKKTIIIAEATRDLKPKDILQANDYRLRTIEVNESGSDVRDIQSLHVKNLTGFLNLNDVGSGNTILPTAVESPESKTFAVHSLRGNEIFWNYYFQAHEHYLSFLTTGQKVSIYLRTAMVAKKSRENNKNTLVEASSGSHLKKFEINKVVGPLEVLAVNPILMEPDKGDRISPINLNKKELKTALTTDSYVGWLTLRLQPNQLAILKSVEPSGELFVIPVNGDGSAAHTITAEQVFPNMYKHQVNELRGGE